MKKFYLLFFGILYSLYLQAQTLNGIIPDNATVGQQNLNTTITATNLFQTTLSPEGNIWEINLKKGAAVIPVFSQWSMPFSTTVLGPDSAATIVSIPFNADTGLYDLELTTFDPNFILPNVTYTAPAAFTVNPPDGYLSGKVYKDLNENGIYDASEPGISGYPVNLQPGNRFQYTDAQGNYSFGMNNGTYVISIGTQASHTYVLTSDSSSYIVTVSNNNTGALDFGFVDGLLSLSPAVTFPGSNLNAIVTSRSLFLTGAQPYGNITYSYFQHVSNPSYQYLVSNANYVVLDSSTVHLVYPVPTNMQPGIYNLVIRTGNLSYYLENALSIIPAPSYLEGHCYFDLNNNGAFDTGEPPVENVRLYLDPDSSFAFSDNLGNFRFGAVLGSHTLSYSPMASSIFTLTSAPSYSFTNTGNQSGFDFGFRSNLPDYTCNIIFSPALMRCNQQVTSYISYQNKSNIPVDGLVYFIPDSGQIYVSSIPPHSSINGDTIFWNFTALQPMETRQISVKVQNPQSGIVIMISGIKAVDGFGIEQFHDTLNWSGDIRCAWDPNDKAVSPQGVDDTHHYTLLSETLEYLIRFQNTGNDTAFTVIIRDTIDASLDLNTFELIAASHTVQVEVDHNRAASFTFNNILLADSVIDEPNSHGFVRYRISPNAGIPDPTIIENTAYIYFDLNPAVVTNTTWNTMVLNIPVGLGEVIRLNDELSFFPNPVTATGYFSIKNPDASLHRLEIFDMKGSGVFKTESNSSLIEFERGDLKSGLYMFRLVNQSNGKVHTGKISLR